uniref:Uncharacterized protein n=1 Tax=Lotharella globosa TaxID=91324 RepID=A0A7S3YAQ1_9EUKA
MIDSKGGSRFGKKRQEVRRDLYVCHSQQTNEEGKVEPSQIEPEAQEPLEPAVEKVRLLSTLESWRGNHLDSFQIPKDKEKADEAKAAGNSEFKSGKFEAALEKYTKAIELCPESEKSSLAAYNCNSAACHCKLENWDAAIESCSEALKCDPDYVKAYVRRSMAYEKKDKPIEAHADIKKACELAPNTARFRTREAKLSVVANERQEKLKNEMLGKLKDLGNTVLGNFGLSLNNFKAQKDPNTGSYNISFQQ